MNKRFLYSNQAREKINSIFKKVLNIFLIEHKEKNIKNETFFDLLDSMIDFSVIENMADWIRKNESTFSSKDKKEIEVRIQKTWKFSDNNPYRCDNLNSYFTCASILEIKKKIHKKKISLEDAISKITAEIFQYDFDNGGKRITPERNNSIEISNSKLSYIPYKIIPVGVGLTEKKQEINIYALNLCSENPTIQEAIESETLFFIDPRIIIKKSDIFPLILHEGPLSDKIDWNDSDEIISISEKQFVDKYGPLEVGINAIFSLLKNHQWNYINYHINQDKEFNWFGWITYFYFQTKLKEIKNQFEAKTLFMPVDYATESYAKIPNFFSGLYSWAHGSQGKSINKKELGKRFYSNLPDFLEKIIVPRSYSLLPNNFKKAYELIFPIEENNIFTESKKQVFIPPSGKLGIIIFAASSYFGSLLKTSVRELTKIINPRVSYPEKKHFDKTIEALNELMHLRILFRKRNVGNVSHCYTIQIPNSIEELKKDRDLEIIAGVNEIIRNEMILKTKENSLRGGFLIDLPGILNLPSNKPNLFKHYIRASAMWNASYIPNKYKNNGKFNIAALKKCSWEEWMNFINYPSSALVEYLKKKKSRNIIYPQGRIYLSKGKDKFRNDFLDLQNRKLLSFEENKTDGTFRLLPPENYLIAWQSIRDNGTKIKPFFS